MQIKLTWPASKKTDLSKVNRRYCILNYCCNSYSYLFVLKLFLKNFKERVCYTLFTPFHPLKISNLFKHLRGINVPKVFE